jgi:hypothetical protein
VLAVFVTAILCYRGLAITRPALARVLLAALAFGAILSGSAEATLMSRRQRKGNLIADEARPALLRLAAIARETADGRLDTKSVVYAPNFVVTGAVPTTAPQPVLWAQYLFVFPDVTLSEDKERLAQFLYYKGVAFTDVDPEHFDLLNGERAYYLSSLISRGRFNPRLKVDWKPITPEEVIAARDYYASFVASFDRARACTSRRYPFCCWLPTTRSISLILIVGMSVIRVNALASTFSSVCDSKISRQSHSAIRRNPSSTRRPTKPSLL